MTQKIDIVEVGPRDGLQNVKEILSVEQKKSFIQDLLNCGFEYIEAGSFVRPDFVPAMSGSDEIAKSFSHENQKLWYLAPNLKGLIKALELGVQQIALFTASSETFNQKNIGMTVEKSLSVIQSCIDYLHEKNYEIITDWNQSVQKKNQIKLRLYISTVIACPYEGYLDPKLTLDIIDKTQDLGFAQYSLGDTIGRGVPKNWSSLLSQISKNLKAENKIALHCHNTYGTALTCVHEGLNHGITTFDSSLGGLGGCPFAKGATGNLATEDLVYFLENQGLNTNLNLNQLFKVFHPKNIGNLPNKSQVFYALQEK